MNDSRLTDPDAWAGASFAEHREMLAQTLREALQDIAGVNDVTIEAGTIGREYDLTALIETDVGRLRAPLWSHARATIFRDPSIHSANRAPLAPGIAVREAAVRLRSRLAVKFTLESRGLTVSLTPEPGVERTWTAEHARFRNRTAVTREDRVKDAGDEDVRNLLAHFYVGPSLRLVDEEGTAFLLPEASEVEGPLISLCHACNHWDVGPRGDCSHCGAVTDVVIAARPPRR